ncbi:MAG: class I SAM-dependent methyltransferase family protein [Caldisphaeraceae archaeon]|nr:class I SAM-dependent methyltransferase family protein [Caldisphaeraceae archaeon]
MDVISNCVCVNKKDAKKVLDILKNGNALRSGLKPKRIEDKIAFAVSQVELTRGLLEKSGVTFEICKDSFEKYKYSFKRLSEVIPGISSYLIIGDIAIINYKKDMGLLKKAARQIMEMNPRIKAVYAKTATLGEFRIPELILLEGEDKRLTIHKENGLRFYIDLAKAYFNPRLAGEHMRIADLIDDGDSVLDMFTGIGGFSINIAKKRKANILGVDINPYAIYLAERNYHINKKILKGDVTFMRADSSRLDKIIANKFNKIIMNNPTMSINYLSSACNLLEKGKSTIFLYVLESKNSNILNKIRGSIKCPYSFEVGKPRKVIEYSPSMSIYEIDIVMWVTISP